jgi:hypothetical protein
VLLSGFIQSCPVSNGTKSVIPFPAKKSAIKSISSQYSSKSGFAEQGETGILIICIISSLLIRKAAGSKQRHSLPAWSRQVVRSEKQGNLRQLGALSSKLAWIFGILSRRCVTAPPSNIRHQ